MTNNSPPAGYDQLGAPFCGHGLQMCHRGVCGIQPELILLTIRATENPVAHSFQSYNRNELYHSEVLKVEQSLFMHCSHYFAQKLPYTPYNARDSSSIEGVSIF